MLQLHKEHPQLQLTTELSAITTAQTFSDSQINDLFGITGLFKPLQRLKYKKEIARLENLQM